MERQETTTEVKWIARREKYKDSAYGEKQRKTNIYCGCRDLIILRSINKDSGIKEACKFLCACMMFWLRETKQTRSTCISHAWHPRLMENQVQNQGENRINQQDSITRAYSR